MLDEEIPQNIDVPEAPGSPKTRVKDTGMGLNPGKGPLMILRAVKVQMDGATASGQASGLLQIQTGKDVFF